MSQIFADPQKLRDFSGNLAHFSQSVWEVMKQAHSDIGRLGNTWRDQQFQEFAQEFERTHRLLHKFVEESRKTCFLLEKDAEAIEAIQKIELK